MAASKWMSDDLSWARNQQKKNFHVVEGAHQMSAHQMSLYHIPKYLDEAISLRSSFFQPTLKQTA
jgi:hypothetical protein